MDKEAYKAEKDLNSAIKISKSLLSVRRPNSFDYELDGIIHTSIWRRHETWQISFIKKPKKNREILS